MPSTATARDPRNRSRNIKRRPRAKDYVARLTRYQRRPLSTAAAKALDEENRGGR